jgi:hypothetical protein
MWFRHIIHFVIIQRISCPNMFYNLFWDASWDSSRDKNKTAVAFGTTAVFTLDISQNQSNN